MRRLLCPFKEILAVLMLGGLTLHAGAKPILVGEAPLPRNQSTLLLPTIRSLVANYNSNHDPALADLPMPETAVKPRRAEFGKAGKNSQGSGAGYFLLKTDRKSVQLFYSPSSNEGSGTGAARSAAASSSGRQSYSAKNRAFALATSGQPEKQSQRDNASYSYPDHSSPAPHAVPDAGGTLTLLSVALGSLGLIGRRRVIK